MQIFLDLTQSEMFTSIAFKSNVRFILFSFFFLEKKVLFLRLWSDLLTKNVLIHLFIQFEFFFHENHNK